MKQVWKEDTEWDEKISGDVQQKWERLKSDILLLQDVEFPRNTVDVEEGVSTEAISLHVFCDGGKSCYGVASAYLEIHKGCCHDKSDGRQHK